MIPKIIHHIAPKTQDSWHPLWKPCRDSWLTQFPDHKFILWNDEEDIDNLVKDHYPEYWETYQEFPTHIMKIDFARLCLLHKHGGIYTDMDVFCYHNFSKGLTSGVYIMQAPYGDIPIENALMVASPGHSFFETCMKMAVESYNVLKETTKITLPFNAQTNREFVLNVAGPKLVFEAIKKYGYKRITPLPGELFNNHGMAYHPKIITRHLLTGVWGKDGVAHIRECKVADRNVLPMETYMAELYFEDVKKYAYMNAVNINNFDFYTDYTNGQFFKASDIWD
jgi:hypothetical protein